jgi:hypothetical protein
LIFRERAGPIYDVDVAASLLGWVELASAVYHINIMAPAFGVDHSALGRQGGGGEADLKKWRCVLNLGRGLPNRVLCYLSNLFHILFGRMEEVPAKIKAFETTGP